MAYIDEIVKFHSFSKSTVRTGLTLGEAVNPSGHTVTSKQVRTDDIPWFVNSFQGDETAARTWAAKNATAARHNDILYYGAEFKQGFTKPSCLIYVAKQEVDGKLVDLPAEQRGWQAFDLNAATTLKNAEGKDVIAIHKLAKVEYVDGNNNAATNSNKQSLFVRRSDGTLLDHFVAATDQIVGGQPSLGYNAVVSVGGKAIDEGEGSGNYIGNTFAGIVHFHAARSETIATDGSVNNITVTCFEYIGDKLDESITSISNSVKDIVNTTMQGVVASVGTTTNATNAGISVDSSVTTSPKIDLTTGSVTAGEAKLVTGGAVATVTDALEQSIAGAKSEAATNLAAARTEITDEIAAAKEQAIANAKVTLTAGTGITIPNSGSQDTAFTVSVDTNVIATKQSVDDLSGIVSKLPATIQAAQDAADAAMEEAQKKVASVSGPTTGLVTVKGDKEVTIEVSDTIATKTDAATAAANAVTTGLATGGNIAQAIATAKSGAEQTAATALSTARGEITTEISTAVSGLETKLTTGEGSLGGRVTALETATDTTLPAAIEQALTDAKAYSDSLHTTSLDYVVLGDSESLPTASADTLGKIYLVASQKAPTADGAAISGSYVEYMTRKVSETEYTWEKIGTTAADLRAYAKKVTLNGQTKTPNATGAIELGTVVTGLYNSLASGTTNDSDQPNEKSIYAGIHNGGLHIGIASATDSVMGVSKLYTGEYYNMASLADKSNTAVSLDTVSDMFTAIADYKADKGTFVSSINDKKGDLRILTHNGISNTPQGTAASAFGYSTGTMLWGTTIVTDSYSDSICLVDSFVGLNDGTHVGYLQIAALPSNAVTVENNFVMDADGKVITTIRPERMYSGFRANSATGLKSFVGDLSNLDNASFGSSYDTRTFYSSSALETFIGDLSSLTDGSGMFVDCTKLTTCITDLSSLTDGTDMFNGCKLDAESLDCIADTINDVRSLTASAQVTKQIKIGYNCSAADAQSAYDAITGKGWTCSMTYNA